jgi:succinylglutamate desuccinylase
MKQLSPQLQQSGDFLQLSRDNEWHLEPFSFSLNSGKDTINVDVWDTGVICFEPDCATDKDVVLSSAVHGNETAPIEICDALIKQVIGGQLKLKQRVLFLFGNPASINIEKRFVQENLNRLFSGSHSEDEGLVNKERHRAKALEQYVERFYTQGVVAGVSGRARSHYDLHTAIRGSKNEKFAIYPYIHGKPWKKAQFEFLLACGVNTFLLMRAPATTFSYFSSHQFDADAFTVELGKVRPFGQNDMASFAATQATLTALLSGEAIPSKPYQADDFHCFDVYRTVDRQNEDFTLNFSTDCENFTDFEVGYVLAQDGDEQHIVDTPGEAIIFPNANVAIGQRALLTVIPMDIGDHVI